MSTAPPAGAARQSTAVVTDPSAANGAKFSKEHFKGIRGLVDKAVKHTTGEAPKKGRSSMSWSLPPPSA